MIVFERVSANIQGNRQHPARLLRQVSISFEPGVHSILGTPGDGADLFLSVLEGSVQPASGNVSIFGKPPSRAAALLASIRLSAALPDSITVSHMVSIAAEMRKASRDQILSAIDLFQLTPLLPRLGKSLRSDDQRAILLAIAVGTNAKAVAIEDPYASMAPSALPQIESALTGLAERGSVVILTTPSIHEAKPVSSAIYRLSRGELVRAALRTSGLIQAAWVRVYSEHAAQLMAPLSQVEFPIDVELHGHVLTARSSSTQFDLSRAMAKAILKAEIRPYAIESAPPDLVPFTPSMAPRPLP